MDDLFSVLWAVNRTPVTNQRSLAGQLEMSVGKVNSLLKEAEEQGLLNTVKEGKGSRFLLTDSGRQKLERAMLSRRQGKLALEKECGPLRTAVILAGGKREDFEQPAALLPLGEGTVISRMVQVLESCGMDRVLIIGGHCWEKLRDEFSGKQNVTVVENPRYKWSGTMQALKLLEGKLSEDFLLLKSDLVLERRGVQALTEGKDPFAALLAAPSGLGDEAFVELDSDGDIFRISKDIHQINRIQGELTGMFRVPAQVFRMMLEYFAENENPYLNFEYVLENIGRLYGFKGRMVDDLVWAKVETKNDYEKLANIIYPRIQRKEKEMQEQYAAQTLCGALGVSREEIAEILFAGGLTNTNYDVHMANGKRYILRLPGRMTESLIDRRTEKQNAKTASDMGFNCRLVYCNAETGVKVSEYIDRAETLNPRTVKLEENLALTADILRRLHDSDMPMKNEFDPFGESLRYESLLSGENARMYKGYEQLRAQVFAIRDRLNRMGKQITPSHNDLVAANLVKDGDGRLYLIDWEYAGKNDPMFDIAALFLENDFAPEDEELFFHYYFKEGENLDAAREKILIFKISQDFLWSIWTVLKEARGDDFGSYGKDRFDRCRRLCAQYWEIYGE